MRLQSKDGVLDGVDNPPITYRMMWPEKLDKPAPGVVLAPGFGSSLQTSAYIQESLERVAELGAVAISFNYSHIKVKSDDEVDTARLTCENADDDLRRVLAFAKENPMIDAKKMVGMGCSFGAHTMFRVKDMDMAAFIAFSLVPDFGKPFQDKLTESKRFLWKMTQRFFGRGTKQMIDGYIQEINYNLFEQAENFDLHENLRDITQPVTLIHGTEDILAAVEDIQQLTVARNVQAHFIQGAGHKFKAEPSNNGVSELQQAIFVAQRAFLKLFSTTADSMGYRDLINDVARKHIANDDASEMRLAL